MPGYGYSYGYGSRPSLAGGGAVTIASWFEAGEINRANLAALVSSKYAASDTINTFGDSYTAGNVTGNVEDPWPEKMGDQISTTINNDGVGGESTAQILTRLTADTAAQAEILTLQGGGNDLGSQDIAYAYTNVIPNFVSMEGLSTGSFLEVYASSQGRNFAKITSFGGGLVFARHRSVNGSLAVDMMEGVWSNQAPDTWTPIDNSSEEKERILVGGMPQNYLLSDDTHPNDAGITGWRDTVVAALLALDGSGSTYVTPDHVALDDSAAENATVHQMLYLGTPTAWSIEGGNDDDTVKINSSGLIQRATGTITQSNQTIYVKAHGDTDAQSWISPVTLMRKAAPTILTGGTRVERHGSIGLAKPGGGNKGLVDECTFIFRLRYPPGTSNAAPSDDTFMMSCMGDQSGVCDSKFYQSAGSGGGVGYWNTVQLVDSTNAVINNTKAGGNGIAINEFEWFWSAMSFKKGVTSTFHWLKDGPSATLQVTPMGIAGGMHNKQAWIGDTLNFFINQNGSYANTGSAPRDLSMLWFAPAWIDLTNSATRDQIYNAGSRAPVALTGAGANEIDGIVPEIYFAGEGPGNWLASENRGSAGLDRLMTTVNHIWPDELYTSVAES